MQPIEWRPIPSLPRYLISSIGDVRHEDSKKNRRFTRHRRGYHMLVFRLLGCRKNGIRLVHGLVAEAFLGPRPLGAQIRHLDGDPTNNRVENLAYGTGVENAADRARHGRTNYGERNGNSVISDADAEKIRSIYAEKRTSQYVLADRFGLSQRQVNRIIRGFSRRHSSQQMAAS